MRLGGPVFSTDTPEAWVAAHQAAGYTAAYWPNVPREQEAAYVQAAADANLLIAEVGAWSNPLSPDPETRKQAVAWCQHQLAVADRVGARCCVNIAGSLGEKWDGPFAADLTEDAFAQIVETTREIIDAVKPTRTYYSLETMPWMYPDSAECYRALIDAIDRERFAVHLDPVNLINCPQRYFQNAQLLRDAFATLGPQVRSCHAKDIRMADNLTVHLDEVAPGDGKLDYTAFLQALTELDPDTPLMLEHLPEEDYPRAAAYIRAVASEAGITLR